MSRGKKIMTAATTFSVALGIGFAMQYGDAVAARFDATESPAPVANDAIPVPTEVIAGNAVTFPTVILDAEPIEMTGEVQVATVTDLPEDIAAPTIDMELMQVAAAQLPPVDIAPVSEPVVSQAAACAVSMTAVPAPMASAELTVSAPCHASTAFTIHHQGMMFTALTDEAGNADIIVPALVSSALFIAAFDDGDGSVAQVELPEVADYDRAVLQWRGENDIHLHAREFGADYGDQGHIWAASVGSVSAVDEGVGGTLTSLGVQAGVNPLMVEVYTFPTGMVARDGEVLLTVEAEVTTRNCGREVAAQSIQAVPEKEPVAVDLVMVMPECDAEGEFLVLKNMFRDLTLASR